MRSNRPDYGSALWVFLLLSLCAFAANSIFCRLALGHDLIDPVSYTTVRIAAGAAVLAALRILRGSRAGLTPDAYAALALITYALCFSLAYRSMAASTGALLLFFSVQMTMIGWGIVHGERPAPQVWFGIAAAVGGLVYLLGPAVAPPHLAAAAMMLAAGVAWGVYSLRGAARSGPVEATTANFIAAVPLAVLCSLAGAGTAHVSAAGVGWALASGALASGLGYVAWYRILPSLSATVAASVQLGAPVLTAGAGVGLLGEPFNLRIALAGGLILSGLAVVMRAAAARRDAG